MLESRVVELLGGAHLVFDGTLGGGGHTAALLARGATLIAVDRDAVAREEAARRLAEHIESGRLTIIAGTFADVAESDALGAEPFDGVLLDLGVSSHQFDDVARGFTFREGAPLDMRMQSDGAAPSQTAAAWLNTADERELARVFAEYGDEPRARRLAHVIAARRANRPLETSDDLVGAIRAALGPRSGAPEFARLFQAVRIEVNDELGELARALPALRDRLAPGGVMVVISYHSGEDRLVKRAFQEWSRGCICPPRQPICTCSHVALGAMLTKKPVEADAGEVDRNPRARSAKLRAWRRAPA